MNAGTMLSLRYVAQEVTVLVKSFAIGLLAFATFTLMISPSVQAFEDPPEEEAGGWVLDFLTAPFRDRNVRYLEYPYEREAAFARRLAEPVGDRFAIEARLMYQVENRDSNGHFVRARWRLPSGLSLALGSDYFVHDDGGSHSRTNHQRLSMGIPIHLGQSLLMDLGIGLARRDDSDNETNALSFDLSGRWFCRRPLSLYANGAIEYFAKRAWFDQEVGAAYHHKRFEVFLGWRSLRESGGPGFRGPLFGVGLWY